MALFSKSPSEPSQIFGAPAPQRPRRQVERKDGRQLHRLTVYLPPELDRQLRVRCAETDQNISDALCQALARWLVATS